MSSFQRHFQAPLRRDILAITLLLMLVLLFLGPGLIPGKIFLPLDIVIKVWPPWQQPNQPVPPQNLMLGDPVNYIFPVKEFAAASLRQGEFPLWNPYSLGGYPFTYNTQAGLFYPLSLIYYVLPAAAAVNLVIVLQMFLGAFFMYLYLRLIVTRRLAALSGAILFTFNGLMVIWLEWQVVYAAVIWLPLQLYLAERMVRRIESADKTTITPSLLKTARIEAILIGITLAIPWLGGHWNWTLYTSMTLGMYLLWRLWQPLKQAQTSRSRRQIAALFVLPLLLGLALSLVQIWPAVHYLSQSHRGDLAFSDSLHQGLLNRLIVLLIPNFFGSPQHQNWWGPAPTNYVETTFFLGILPLLLAGLAPFLRRDNVTRFYVTWGVIGLLWALGTPAYGLLYVLPIFGGLLPSRAAILVVFCFSVLAAIAFDSLINGQPVNRQRLGRISSSLLITLFLLALVYIFYYRTDVARTWDYLKPYTALFFLSLCVSGGLLAGYLRGWLSATLFGWLVVGWLTVDLFAFGFGYNPVASVDDLYPLTSTATFLQNDPEIFRMTTLAQGAVYPPNTALVHRLTNVSGYEPGILRRVINFINAAEGGNAIRSERELIPLQGASSPLLALLNVKYVVTTEDRWDTAPVPGAAADQVTEWLTLAPGVAIDQTITMPDAGLHRLDVSLQPIGEPSGMVIVRVFTADGVQELAHATLDVAEVRETGWYSFFFAAFPSEWGRTFYVTVAYEGTGALAAGMNDGAGLAFVTYYLPRPQLVHEDGRTRIYLNEDYLPRAFAVPQAILVQDEAEALAALQTYAEELDRVVILEPDAAGGLISLSASQPSAFQPVSNSAFSTDPPPQSLNLSVSQSPLSNLQSSHPVTITEYTLNHIELTTTMPEPGFVVLADTYYPGWQAILDGEKTTIYRANSILRAIYVPAGQHTITFTFRPPDFFIGLGISGLTLISCIFVILKWGYTHTT